VSLFIRICAFALALSGCSSEWSVHRNQAQGPSSYLLVFAGDGDAADEDFMAVIDVRAGSSTVGKVVSTRPVGTRDSMPHHFEYRLPPKGELLFANSHHHEETLLLDFSDPLRLVIARRLRPPPPYRFPHDFARLPNGKVLGGFLRSEGPSPRPGDATLPGGHGGIAEYTAAGQFIRASSAAADTTEPVRPYGIAPLPAIDRIVTTSAAMMEESAADVVQIWRYSDLRLLHTISVPPGRSADGSATRNAATAPFGPRVLADGTVLLNAYGCGIYHLTGIASDRPRLVNVFTIDASEPSGPGAYRGACAVPVIVSHRFWLMPVGTERAVLTLDIANPTAPRLVSRLDLPRNFAAHWLSPDPRSNRLVLGAHQGGQEGMFLLLVDPATGRLRFDPAVRSPGAPEGYIDLTRQRWPHGDTGAAWAHAALFLSDRDAPD
jgi:hypothetical protein